MLSTPAARHSDPQGGGHSGPMIGGMSPRRTLAALLASLCLALSACASATPPETTTPDPAAEQPSTPAAVLDQARDVASQLEQRDADLESMVP